MPKNAIKNNLDRLAKGIVLADASQSAQLTDLSGVFEEISRLTNENGEARLSDASQSGADLLSQIASGNAADPEAAFETVERLVNSLQAILIDGQPEGEIEQFLSTVADLKGSETVCEDEVANGEKEPDGHRVHLEPFVVDSDPDLLAEFITESNEHLDAVEGNLLTFEQEEDGAEALNGVFRAFHTIKGVAGFLDLKLIQQLAHETETLLDRARNGTLELDGDSMEIVFESTDAMKVLVGDVAKAMSDGEPVIPSPALSDLIDRICKIAAGETVDVPTAVVQGSLSSKEGQAIDAVASEGSESSDSSPAVQSGAIAGIPQEKIEAKPEKKVVKKPSQGMTAPAAKETIRVDSDRLDKLVDTIGEMVIAEAMVAQAMNIDSRGSTDESRILNHLDKITRELQELAMSMRMVPVKATFQRMTRLARDVSKKLDKQVNFVVDGEETELDKNVVDAIGDPLVHMVRNSIDHGIEDSAEDRVNAGKPAVGQVELRAFHQGGNIYIEIEDDGAGLDREKLIAKAVSNGVIEDGDNLSDAEVFSLIFEPGFSTAKTVTDVSGRGVGLDVVKRSIQALRGKTEIRSELGKGTVFSIRLPLTLAIIDGMVIRLGEQRLILPTLSIVRMVRPDESQISTVFGRGEMLKLGDRLVPLFRLNQVFDLKNAEVREATSAVVVVEHENQQVAFEVDELLGQQQIVIKPLGTMIKNIAGFSGGAIMPDGRVGLILDVPGLAALASEVSEKNVLTG